jgi:hypothetical protein
MKLEFHKITFRPGAYYWAWLDVDYLPYARLEEKDLKALPYPVYIPSIHPDCPIGTPCTGPDTKTNELHLTKTFEELPLHADLRKDLRRVEKKNAQTIIIENEKDALLKSHKWFLEQFAEEEEDFRRRLHVWKNARTLSAYTKDELLAVHITLPTENTVYYLGCWWNRNHKTNSPATYLLKKDIENAIKNGITVYDLGIGSEPYKKQWGVTERNTKYYLNMPKPLEEELVEKQVIEK